MKRKYEQTI